MSLFHSLYEPNSNNAPAAGLAWDRAGFYPRRAFYSRPLIVSGGPDTIPGVARLFSVNESAGSLGALLGVGDGSGAAVPLNAANLVLIENQAAALDPSARRLHQSSVVAAPEPPSDADDARSAHGRGRRRHQPGSGLADRGSSLIWKRVEPNGRCGGGSP